MAERYLLSCSLIAFILPIHFSYTKDMGIKTQTYKDYNNAAILKRRSYFQATDVGSEHLGAVTNLSGMGDLSNGYGAVVPSIYEEYQEANDFNTAGADGSQNQIEYKAIDKNIGLHRPYSLDYEENEQTSVYQHDYAQNPESHIAYNSHQQTLNDLMKPLDQFEPEERNPNYEVNGSSSQSHQTDVINYIPYPVVKKQHVPVEKPVQIPLSHAVIVPVRKPVPIHIPIQKQIQVPVEKELRIPVERLVPVPMVKSYPVPVEKPVPYHVVKIIPIKVPQPFPVKVPVFKTVLHKVKSWW